MKTLIKFLSFPVALFSGAALAGPELGEVQLQQNIRVDVLGCLEESSFIKHSLCIPEGSPKNIQLLDAVSPLNLLDPDEIKAVNFNGYNAWNSAVSSETVSPAIKKLSWPIRLS